MSHPEIAAAVAVGTGELATTQAIAQVLRASREGSMSE